MGSSTISVDEFQALEQKVLQTVELIKKEREARAAAESQLEAARSESAELKERLAAADEKLTALSEQMSAASEKLTAGGEAQKEIESLYREREAVKLRVEKMLAQMDELL